MPAPVDARAASTGLLVFEAGGSSLALRSDAVASVLRLEDWPGALPSDALERLGAAQGGGSAGVSADSRVVVLRHAGRDLPLLVRGRLSLLAAEASDLLDLPPEVTRGAPLLAQVALVGGKPALLVLATERLFQADQLGGASDHALVAAAGDSR